MNKLLVFLMVLGLTSFASAALTGVELSVNGQTNGEDTTMEVTIATCETVIIDVMGPAQSGYAAAIYILGDFPGITGGEWGDELGPPYEPMCSSYYYEATGYPIVHKPEAGDDAAFARRYEYAGWGYGYELSAAAFSGEPTGGKQFEFLFHCCSEGDVTIEIADYGDWAVADTVIIHQIPEPATIALLGLGGLLLRRRK